MEVFIDIMTSIGQVIVLIFKYIIKAIASISEWIGEFFGNEILPMMPTMLKFFSNKTLNIIIFCIVAGYILIINIISVSLFASDKKKAKRRDMRISEGRLMRSCFWGGAIGGMIGMHMFNHKTKKKKFFIIVPILFVIQLILHSFVLGFLGFWAFF